MVALGYMVGMVAAILLIKRRPGFAISAYINAYMISQSLGGEAVSMVLQFAIVGAFLFVHRESIAAGYRANILDVIALAFFCLISASTMWSAVPESGAGAVARFGFFMLVSYAMGRGFALVPGDRQLALRDFTIATLLFCTIGTYASLSEGFNPLAIAIGARASVGNPVGTSTSYVIASVSVLYFMMSGRETALANGRPPPGPVLYAAWAVMLAVMLVGIVLNGSRSAVLAVLFAGLFYFLLKDLSSVRKWLFVLVFSTIATIFGKPLIFYGLDSLFRMEVLPYRLQTLAKLGLLFLQSDGADKFQAKLDVSASIRAELWNSAAEMIAEKPLFGHGLGTFEYLYDNYPHNVILETFVAGGAVAGITLVSFFCLAIGGVMRGYFFSKKQECMLIIMLMSAFFMQIQLSFSIMNIKALYFFCAYAACYTGSRVYSAKKLLGPLADKNGLA